MYTLLTPLSNLRGYPVVSFMTLIDYLTVNAIKSHKLTTIVVIRSSFTADVCYNKTFNSFTLVKVLSLRQHYIGAQDRFYYEYVGQSALVAMYTHPPRTISIDRRKSARVVRA